MDEDVLILFRPANELGVKGGKSLIEFEPLGARVGNHVIIRRLTPSPPCSSISTAQGSAGASAALERDGERSSPFHVAKLVAAIEDDHAGVSAMARPILRLLADGRSLDGRVVVLDRELARRAREDGKPGRLTTSWDKADHGDGVVALAPAAEAFKRGRDFAA